jgi:hypothetical protein
MSLYGLELFAGSRSFGKAAEQEGHAVLSTDIKQWGGIHLVADILDITKQDLGDHFDFIWASPDCTTYSIAACSTHRFYKDGWPQPKTQKAVIADMVIEKMFEIISWYPQAKFFIENPQGLLKKMPIMQPNNNPLLRNIIMHRVTYCQYETDKPASERRRKPTNIWTNHEVWNPRTPCENGDLCHASAPRGSKTGTQGLKGAHERSKIPHDLCLEIVRSL